MESVYYVYVLFFFSSRRRHTICALVMEFRRVLFRSRIVFSLAQRAVKKMFATDKGQHACIDAYGQGGAPSEMRGHISRIPVEGTDRKSTRLNSSHQCASRMPSYA